MTVAGKIIFIIIIIVFYAMSYLVAESNSIKAMQKLFIIIIGSALILSVIFSERVFNLLEVSLGVANGADGVLYLFIIFSLAINIVFLRKIQILERRIIKFAQHFAIDSLKKNKK